MDNTFLSLAQSAEISESEEIRGLSYPITRDPVREYIFHPLMTHLGGVKTNNHVITGAKAMKLTFMLDDSTKLRRRASMVFINLLNKYLQSLELRTANLTIFNPKDVETELIDNIQTAFENNFQLIVIVICAFTIYSCMRSAWVRAKPLLGVAGLLSIILAAFSGETFYISIIPLIFYLSFFRLRDVFVSWLPLAGYQRGGDLPHDWHRDGRDLPTALLLDQVRAVQQGSGDEDVPHLL